MALSWDMNSYVKHGRGVPHQRLQGAATVTECASH